MTVNPANHPSAAPERNANARLEALSDGVFAIAMTLLVIEVRAPDPESIHNASDLWSAVRHAMPTIAAFILSFTIIFITWVNHHAAIRSIPRTSAAFLFANGFMLLTVAFIPYPTALLGEFILTDHAAPAVVLYNAVLAAQAVSWTLFTRSALRGRLTRDDDAAAALRASERSSYGALVLYSLLSILAIWLPVVVAIVTTATWIVWLVMSLRARHA
jgi:uncharacterized membrane protein